MSTISGYIRGLSEIGIQVFAIALLWTTTIRARGATDYAIVTFPGDGQALGIDSGIAVGVSGAGATVWYPNGPTTILAPPVSFPPFVPKASAIAISGNEVVGGGEVTDARGTGHALIWDRTSGAVTDLTPNTSQFATAVATDGVHQAGSIATGTGNFIGAYWSGTPDTFVNLGLNIPTGSQAYGVSGNMAVGYANLDPRPHAVVWQVSGSTATYADLHPGDTFASSAAYGASDGQVVGTVVQPMARQGLNLAALWMGPTAGSFVNLGPGIAYATNGNQQVGVDAGRAVVWSGSASSIQGLPIAPGYTQSVATGIDAQGNISGYIQSLEAQVPVIWSPTRLPGDANDDGKVDFSDFNVLARDFGRTNVGFVGGDFNGDGVVNFADFNVLAAHFLQTLTLEQAGDVAAFGRSLAVVPAEESAVDEFATSHSVPEPNVIPVLLASLGPLCRRRRA